MQQFKVIILLAILLAGCTHSSKKQEQLKDLKEASNRALDLIENALEQHGDIADPELRIALSIVADSGIHRGQSLVALPPYERYRLETEFYINRPDTLELGVFKNRFAGFEFINTVIHDADSVVRYENNTKTRWKANAVGFNSFRYFPHIYLRNALEHPTALSYEGEISQEDSSSQLISTNHNGSRRLLYLDAVSGLLSKVETLRNYAPYGDGIQTLSFKDYASYGPLKLPQRLYSGSDYGAWGGVSNEFSIAVIPDAERIEIDHQAMQAYKLPDYTYRPDAQLKKLAEGIYVLENITESKGQWSYNVLFAELEEGVLVAEAPISNEMSQKAMAVIKRIFPDKPITHLVQSHHHDDHWGGIREYMGVGATIVTTQGNFPLLQRIAKAPFRLNPDLLYKNNTAVSFEIVNKKRSLQGGSRIVEVHDIGPTAHANEMLALYFPNEKILWQADMINYGEWSTDNILKDQLVDKIKSLDLDVEILVGLHGKVLNKEEIDALLQGTL